MKIRATDNRRKKAQRGVTLIEVVISAAIAGVTIGSMMTGYVMASKRAEWSGFNLAAHSLAMQRVEQARACKWDLGSFPVVDQLVSGNFPPHVDILDLPVSGTNAMLATNFTTITTLSTNPPLKSIRVDCVWMFLPDARLFTNTIMTYRGPDNF